MSHFYTCAGCRTAVSRPARGELVGIIFLIVIGLLLAPAQGLGEVNRGLLLAPARGLGQVDRAQVQNDSRHEVVRPSATSQGSNSSGPIAWIRTSLLRWSRCQRHGW